ncbi:PREDICTED: zinc finger protein 280C isoform X1 [Dipodomys ordii]|uniref:Zinc finger protein 280C isoform X1 n=1 Tax=Dipodomys ordii TaxID=10020 RepID=A0A1S3FBZ9_DIPOR|nr:PREDICTED: zinc finger protein 280C isoform X1 [Dipodomys ordii]
MDNKNPNQQKTNSKMEELFMECEEEELEPWQRKIEETQNKDDGGGGGDDDDDDELIFVGEVSSSKPAISTILNRGNSSSSSRGIKNEALGTGISDTFKSKNQHYKDPPSDPVAGLPRFHPESKSSESPHAVQNISKPELSKNSSRVDSHGSSMFLFDLTNDTIPLSPGMPKKLLEEMDQTSFGVTHLPASKVNSINPPQPKTSQGVSETNISLALSSKKFSSEASSSQIVVTTGSNTSSNSKNGAPFRKSCPKCNIQFRHLTALRSHMKHCCPDMVNNSLGTFNIEISSADKDDAGSEKGKLIMVVNDFYYGRHEGTIEEELKTYTNFKCFSCLKVLKNNIRFMNHMKHHLELEKQNNESWENHTTCQHCYRQYPTPFQLQCHIESTHTPHEFSTICKICELSFETEHILLQHMKDTHKPGEMPYICQVCQFRSSIFSDVETHFRIVHENTKNLLCPFCLKVSKMATPYMNHYMKHQKKGVHRCMKCRLQFLTYKEKIEHKAQHRTFIKPKELEGLLPGTKITIRASLGPVQALSSTDSSCIPSTSLQILPSTSTGATTKNLKNPASKYKTNKQQASVSTAAKPNTSRSSTNTSKCKGKQSCKQRRQRNRKNAISIALKNLRYCQGIHKCIECHSKIKDFASHFSLSSYCDHCKYNTNCNKAFLNHTVSFHGSQPLKWLCLFKKHSGALRGITLVCLKCDFLTDASGLDRMAKHLSHRKTHTCQVIVENVSESTSTSEPTSHCSWK